MPERNHARGAGAHFRAGASFPGYLSGIARPPADTEDRIGPLEVLLGAQMARMGHLFKVVAERKGSAARDAAAKDGPWWAGRNPKSV